MITRRWGSSRADSVAPPETRGVARTPVTNPQARLPWPLPPPRPFATVRAIESGARAPPHGPSRSPQRAPAPRALAAADANAPASSQPQQQQELLLVRRILACDDARQLLRMAQALGDADNSSNGQQAPTPPSVVVAALWRRAPTALWRVASPPSLSTNNNGLSPGRRRRLFDSHDGLGPSEPASLPPQPPPPLSAAGRARLLLLLTALTQPESLTLAAATAALAGVGATMEFVMAEEEEALAGGLGKGEEGGAKAALSALARGLWARVSAAAPEPLPDLIPPTSPGELGAALATAARMGLLAGSSSSGHQEQIGALVAAALPRWDAWGLAAASSILDHHQAAAAASDAAAYAGLLHGLAAATPHSSSSLAAAAEQVAARLRRALRALAPNPDLLDAHSAARALVATATLGMSLEESGESLEDSPLPMLLLERALATAAGGERAAALCAALALGLPAASVAFALPPLRGDLASGALPDALVAQLLQGLALAAEADQPDVAAAASTAADAARGLLERHRQRVNEGDEEGMASSAPFLALALDGALRLLPPSSVDALLPRAALASALHRACACAAADGGPRLPACALTVAAALAPPAPPAGWAAAVLGVLEEGEEEDDEEGEARLGSARAAVEALDAWASAAI